MVGSIYISMDKLIGKKGKDIEPGYVWVPYIMAYDVVSVPGFSNAKMTSSKIEKIKKILEKIEDFNITSS